MQNNINKEVIFNDPNEQEDEKVDAYNVTKEEYNDIQRKARNHFAKKKQRWDMYMFEGYPDAENKEELKLKLIAQSYELRALDNLLWSIYFNQQNNTELADNYLKNYFDLLAITSMMLEFYNRNQFKRNYKTFKKWHSKINKFYYENNNQEKTKKEKKPNNN